MWHCWEKTKAEKILIIWHNLTFVIDTFQCTSCVYNHIVMGDWKYKNIAKKSNTMYVGFFFPPPPSNPTENRFAVTKGCQSWWECKFCPQDIANMCCKKSSRVIAKTTKVNKYSDKHTKGKYRSMILYFKHVKQSKTSWYYKGTKLEVTLRN